MKIANISLIIVVIIIVAGLFGLSSVFAATGAGQVNLLAPQIDVEATAQAIKLQNRQVELEDAAYQRLQIIQAQIDQTRNSLDQLDRIIKSQAEQQSAQLDSLQMQAAQQQKAVNDLQATATFLNQAIVQDETDHRLEMMALQSEFEQSESELNANLQLVANQVAAAEAELDDRESTMPSRIEGAPVSVRPPSGDDDRDSNDSSSSDDSKSDDDHPDESDEDDD
jgi:hypothetical protein